MCTFKEFYQAYPRHEKPRPAERAFNRLTQSERLQALEDCQKRFIGRQKCFIPLPATYLNAHEWEGDLPPTMEVKSEWPQGFDPSRDCRPNESLEQCRWRAWAKY